MAWYHPQTVLDKVFEFSIILKGIDGLLELIAAVLLIFVKPEQIQGFIAAITQKELLEDPNDMVANFLVHSTASIHSSTLTFAVVYLLVHAGIKLVAVIGILRKKLWAYPFSLITLGILVIYQIYSIFEKFSIGMLLLTIFDVFILWMIWREYGKFKGELAEKPEKINAT
jgi:uncharacterized membrane protein